MSITVAGPDEPVSWNENTTEPPAAADVVDLGAARTRREDPPPDSPAEAGPSPRPDEHADPAADGEDAESLPDEPDTVGGPVDPADEFAALPAVLAARAKEPRRPIVPDWARSPAQLRTVGKWAAGYAGYVAGYHASRLPKYAAKTALWAPVGAGRSVGRVVRWATAEEGNWALRQAAAGRGDAEQWIRLDRQRQRQATVRWPMLILAAIGAAGVLWLLRYGPLPGAVRAAGFAGLVAVCARAGRPADRPITDRVRQGQKYRKLTADLVRRGLTSLGLAGINQAVAKDPNAISFPVEIGRDGPGHLAIVDLPYGVEAGDVIARRGKLASALRLPIDQVWPEPAPGHPGRLGLWIGFEPASQMRQPTWPLLAPSAQVDVFKPFPFATTPRLDAVNAELMYRNWLFGGQPGSGKTFALRLLALAAALDPRAEVRGYELKGVGDFKPLAPVLTEYGNGFDDDTKAACAGMFDWLYEECQRRARRIDHYAGLGKCPENKTTPELASLPGSGLHPLVVFVDEIQELFLSRWGKDAGEMAEKVIKLGRALGVILILGTQIPDKDSLPPGITRNVNTRMCLSVADQVANDMILGTSAYKLGYRATVFEPGDDAGWGILAGLGKPGSRKSFYVNNDGAEKLIARAIALRTAAGTLPDEAERTRDTGPAYDLLADVAAVWPAGEDAVWNETLLERLGERRPDVYAGWKPVQLTGALATHGVSVGQVGRRIDGKTINRRGPARADLTNAVAERNRKRAAS
jgi:S-DNA-T family DNA segregation ATPase FtsK/SpoIIIE